MSLFRDLKIAVRHLSKSPGFVATAVLMLALGIGATTAIFSIVEGVLLRPLPFPHPDRLMVLADIIQGADVGGNDEAGVTIPDIRNYTRDTHSFSSLGGYQPTGYELSGLDEPAAVNATRMTGGVFPALGVAPLLGRVFTQEEDEQHQLVAVLSYSTWQSRFHGDAGILGKKILLDRKPYVVIGVMPRDFEFPLVPGHLNQSELWTPFSFTEQELATSSAANWSYGMVGRLKDGVTAEQAVSDAGRVAAETVRNYPAFMAGFSIRPVVRPLHEETVEQARPLVRTLFLAVARGAADCLREPCRIAAGAGDSQTAGGCGAAGAGGAGGDVAAAGDPGEPGIERGRRRDRPGAGGDCAESGLETVAGDAATNQRDWPGLAGGGLRPGAGGGDGCDLRAGSGICGDPDERERHAERRRTHGHLGRRACAAAFGAGGGGDCHRAGAAGGIRAAAAQL